MSSVIFTYHGLLTMSCCCAPCAKHWTKTHKTIDESNGNQDESHQF